MDWKYEVEKFEFLKEVMTYQLKKEKLNLIVIESTDDIDILLKDWSQSLYLTYSKYSMLDYLTVSGLAAFFTEVAKSHSPGFIQLVDFDLSLLIDE